MAVLSSVNVNLALTCVESAFYGIFFLLTVTSLAVLAAKHGRDTNGLGSSFSVGSVVRSPLFVATIMLLLTVTAHWIITVQRLFDAFVYMDAGQNPGPYFLTVKAPAHVAATACVVASVIVGDIILTYRTWVVWDRKVHIILFPTLFTTGYAAAGISVVQLFAVLSPGESIFVHRSQLRVIPTASLTLATNIYGTAAIAYRIWATNRAMRHERMMLPGMSLAEALVIFVESAALQTSWALFFLVAFAARSPLEAFAFHTIPAAVGISFMLIIARVGLGFSAWAHSGSAPPAPPAHATRKPLAPSRAAARGAQDSSYPLRMIALSVTRTVECETDFALPQAGGDKGRRLPAERDSDSDVDMAKSVEEV